MEDPVIADFPLDELGLVVLGPAYGALLLVGILRSLPLPDDSAESHE
jgi:hypothetical protein